MTSNNLTLAELNREIKSCIESRFTSPVWVIAEINSLNIHRSGHCYLELVQKSEFNDSVIASARGVIWSLIFNRLKISY